jgi:hypothetical protein
MNYFRKYFGGLYPNNYPKKYDKRHYDSIIKKYINHLQKFEEVKAVFQIGNIGVYGVSDLDFLIILDDKKNIKDPKKYSIYNLVPKNNKIVQHDSFIVPLSLVNDISYLTSVFEYKILHSKLPIKKIEFPKINESSKELIFIHLLDLASINYLTEYTTLKNQIKLNILLVISRINSLKYPYILINILTKDKKPGLLEIEKFINEFNFFRKNIFSFSKFKIFIKLKIFLKRAVTVSGNFINLIIDLNKENNFFMINFDEDIFSKNPNKDYYNFIFNNYKIKNHFVVTNFYQHELKKRTDTSFHYYQFIEKNDLMDYMFYDLRKFI